MVESVSAKRGLAPALTLDFWYSKRVLQTQDLTVSFSCFVDCPMPVHELTCQLTNTCRPLTSRLAHENVSAVTIADAHIILPESRNV